MAIVVEDGTIVAGANSYVTEAELTTYATARGITIAGDTEELLIKAMDYIESLAYKGIKFTQDQPLQWPRANVVVDGYLIATDEIPQELKNGEMETAISIDEGEDPLADIPRVKSKTTVGPISVEYKDGSGSTTLVRRINAQLRKLLRSAGGVAFPVSRG